VSTLYQAREINTSEVYDFRKLNALVRRLGGTNYQVEADGVFDPPERTVMVLRPNRKVGGQDIRALIRVPFESISTDEPLPVSAAEIEQWERDDEAVDQ
jgi:hypothetical protein